MDPQQCNEGGENLGENRDEPYASPLGVSSLRERLGTGYP
jgi:hypothetical protein